jgi:pimeloyl-ACP methyl ester carboxylesterase
VLCAPTGQEGLRAHRMLRQLAATLAQSGFHVLRFDYFATGDSAGESDEGSVERWIEDIGEAADELKDASGVHGISLVGFGFGGTLAALASRSRRDLETLVMVEPVVSGGAYLQELQRMHVAFMADELPGRALPVEGSEPQEILGWPLPRRLRERIAATDLLEAWGCPARRVVVIGREEGEEVLRIVARAGKRGSRASFVVAADASAWNQDTVFVPAATLQAVVEALG